MVLVPVDKIPKKASEVIDVPTENLVEIYKFCKEMEQVCDTNNGVGLSAVQVGKPWKLFIVKDSKGEYSHLINCDYRPVDGRMVDSVEGCLSLLKPDGKLRHFKVKRYDLVRLVGKELIVVDGRLLLDDVDEVAQGFLSVVYQHEIEHARGILISDIGEEIFIN